MARGRWAEKSEETPGRGANVRFEAQLWKIADALRNNMDAAEYKHVVLGLIFLRYISDAFDEAHSALVVESKNGVNPEDPGEYRAPNLFWVPKDARWSKLKDAAKLPEIGTLIGDAIVAIERDNPTLQGVLPKDFARTGLDKARLGQLIDLVSNIDLGDAANRSKDVLGREHEYFLTQFASAEGKNGGQFYTPRSVVQLLVAMLAPYKGRVYDPCCGSGGMFVQSEKFIEAHGGKIGDLSIYGQGSSYATWRPGKTNLVVSGIEAGLNSATDMGLSRTARVCTTAVVREAEGASRYRTHVSTCAAGRSDESGPKSKRERERHAVGSAVASDGMVVRLLTQIRPLGHFGGARTPTPSLGHEEPEPARSPTEAPLRWNPRSARRDLARGSQTGPRHWQIATPGGALHLSLRCRVKGECGFCRRCSVTVGQQHLRAEYHE